LESDAQDTLARVLAIAGLAVGGFAAFVSLLTYLRDRHKLDVQGVEGLDDSHLTAYYEVRVVNHGRQPVYRHGGRSVLPTPEHIGEPARAHRSSVGSAIRWQHLRVVHVKCRASGSGRDRGLRQDMDRGVDHDADRARVFPVRWVPRTHPPLVLD
jgi:hypothetical protein